VGVYAVNIYRDKVVVSFVRFRALQAYTQLAMPGRFCKMPKYASSHQTKLLFYGFMHKAKKRKLKARNKFRHTLLYSTYSGYISEAATEGSYVMEGAAIIKLAGTLWLESQVNVSNAKSLKNWAGYGFLYSYPTKGVEATISFMEINLDSTTVD
jgi:hypothetical protein